MYQIPNPKDPTPENIMYQLILDPTYALILNSSAPSPIYYALNPEDYYIRNEETLDLK